MVKGTWIALGVLGAIALIGIGIVASAVGSYNKLVEQDERTDKQANIVGTAYDRAFELIPNLVKLAERFQANETQIHTGVAALRSGLATAQNGTFEQREEFREQYFQTLLLIAGRAEAYPQLRGDRLFQDAMDEMTNTVNKVAAEKVRYNDYAAEYNAYRRSCCFPALIAGMFGFEEKAYIGARDPGRTIEDMRI